MITAAASDPGWDTAHGEARTTRVNVYVSNLLAGTPAIAELDAALRKRGYHIKRLSVEKVLVGAGADMSLPACWLPFDALVWLEMERSAGTE